MEKGTCCCGIKILFISLSACNLRPLLHTPFIFLRLYQSLAYVKPSQLDRSLGIFLCTAACPLLLERLHTLCEIEVHQNTSTTRRRSLERVESLSLGKVPRSLISYPIQTGTGPLAVLRIRCVCISVRHDAVIDLCDPTSSSGRATEEALQFRAPRARQTQRRAHMAVAKALVKIQGPGVRPQLRPANFCSTGTPR